MLGPSTPVRRHSSLPVSGSWLVISLPLDTTSSTRFALCHRSGELHDVPGSGRATRHFSAPLFVSKHTSTACSSSKLCTKSLPASSASELAVP